MYKQTEGRKAVLVIGRLQQLEHFVKRNLFPASGQCPQVRDPDSAKHVLFTIFPFTSLEESLAIFCMHRIAHLCQQVLNVFGGHITRTSVL